MSSVSSGIESFDVKDRISVNLCNSETAVDFELATILKKRFV